MRKLYLLLLLLFVFGEVYSQESILEEINTTLSNNNQENSNLEGSGIESAHKNILDSANLQNEADTLEKDLASLQVQEIDTQLFKQRMEEVKKPVSFKKLQSEQEWSRESMIVNTIKYDKKHVLDTNYQVFGWHPYWSGDAYKSYNFSLLSMISYFSYELNPKTGFYNTIHSWRKTALIDSAKKYNCKVLLTITNFGEKNNRTFLNSTEAKKNLISTAITLLRERNADGLTIDFENIASSEKEKFINFIIDLSTNLKSENEDYILSIAIPAVDFENVFDFNLINSYTDLYIMMGYEYHGSNSVLAGPVAPLSNGNKWTGFTIESSVDEFLAKGIPPKKFILGVPYYGAEWITKDLKFPSPAKSFIKYHSYRQAKRIAGKRNGEVDDASMSRFHTYSDMSYNYRQLWYEDSVTLGVKYNWVKEKQIGGVGIWALGYDNGHDELWKLLANKFAYTDDEIKKIERSRRSFSARSILLYARRLVKNPKSLIKRPRAFLRLFGVFTGVSMVGLFIVFRYGRRFKRLFGLVLKGGISAIVILTIALIFIFLKYFDIRELLFLIGGFLLGGILFLLFSRRYISEKDLP